jgi:hypothetical protein
MDHRVNAWDQFANIFADVTQSAEHCGGEH